MKKFALLVAVVALGAAFIVNCGGNKPANTPANAAPANDAGNTANAAK